MSLERFVFEALDYFSSDIRRKSQRLHKASSAHLYTDESTDSLATGQRPLESKRGQTTQQACSGFFSPYLTCAVLQREVTAKTHYIHLLHTAYGKSQLEF